MTVRKKNACGEETRALLLLLLYNDTVLLHSASPFVLSAACLAGVV